MALLKGVERAPRSEALMKGFVVDTVRGVIRVRKWPRKRGTPKSALQLWWIDWFRQANKLAKYVDAASMRRAIELTAKSGMYPRDILLAAMRGRLYHWYDKNGKRWRSMAAIQDISESLDILAQDIGNVLVRAIDRWKAAGPAVPVIGHILTYQGAAAPPVWAAPAGSFNLKCMANRSSSFSLPNGSTTAIPFNNDVYDPLGMHDAAGDDTDFIVPSGYSWARCTSFLHINSNTTGQRICGMRKGGATFPGYADLSMSSKDTSLQRLCSITQWFPIDEDDVLTMVAFQNSGSARSIGTDANNLSFGIELA